jgi:hypothetical protein
MSLLNLRNTASMMFLIHRLLKFTKDELPWFTDTFIRSVKGLKELVKLFDPIANAIAEYGTIESVAILEVEVKSPKKIGWRHSKWPALFTPRANPIPSDKISIHEDKQDDSSVMIETKG